MEFTSPHNAEILKSPKPTVLHFMTNVPETSRGARDKLPLEARHRELQSDNKSICGNDGLVSTIAMRYRADGPVSHACFGRRMRYARELKQT